MTKVCVLGLWHLGSVTSACLANFGYDVIGFDKDESLIQNLKRAKAPIFEPGLDALLKKNLDNKRLLFTTNIQEAVQDAKYILLSMDTHVDDQDMVNLNSVYDIVNEIADLIADDAVIIIQSQVPVRTCEDFIRIIKQKRSDVQFGLAYCPENLRLGKAIEIFEHPDRIIIGANDELTANKVESLFDIIDCPKIKMDLKSAEMTKHTINAFLATCISFINWIGNICEEVGADVNRVSEGLKSENRIGRGLPLRAGLGFSGGTLARDLKILARLGNELGIKPDLIESVLSTNHEQNFLVIKKLEKVFNTLNGLRIGILGLTYKPETNTLRRSTSVEIINKLLKLNVRVNAYDPSISYIDSISDQRFQLCNSAYSAAENTNALLIFTDWPEFKKLDYNRIFNSMKNSIVFDMKNFLDGKKLKTIGFDYRGLGN